MAEIEVINEAEDGRGWVFGLRVTTGGEERRHRATLSWADYNLWSPDGSDPPEADQVIPGLIRS